MSKEIKVTLPTIHMNGDRLEVLLEGYREAMDAIQIAKDALSACSPNGRNYYPQGPDALTAAIAEHQARFIKLQCVYDELMALAVHCSDEVNRRNK